MRHGCSHQTIPVRPVAARVTEDKHIRATRLWRHPCKETEPEYGKSAEDEPTHTDCRNALRIHLSRGIIPILLHHVIPISPPRNKQQVPPLRCAPVGMTLHWENQNYFLQQKCHPDRSVPGFPATQHGTSPRVRLSVRERRMNCTNATKVHRKSGGAKWRDLLFIFLVQTHIP
jgi:hypothetical protein